MCTGESWTVVATCRQKAQYNRSQVSVPGPSEQQLNTAACITITQTFNSQIYSKRTFGQLAVRFCTFYFKKVPKFCTKAQVHTPSSPFYKYMTHFTTSLLQLRGYASNRKKHFMLRSTVSQLTTAVITAPAGLCYRQLKGLRVHIWQNKSPREAAAAVNPHCGSPGQTPRN